MLRSGLRDDRGWAMLTVLFAVLVMTVFATVALAVVTNRAMPSAREAKFQAASQAAMAGVDDYVARLQANPNYFVTGNADPTNPAFTGYADLPGGATIGQFHYTVDTGQAYTTGVLKITSTGRVDGVDRTVTAALRKADFLDYMYFTKYETLDPQAYQSAVALPHGTNCAVHRYEGRSDDCSTISFGSFDTLQGPVHSQDTMVFNGNPTFENEFSTEWEDPHHDYWTCLSGYTCHPDFADDPTYSIIPFPNTNITLQQFADPAQGGLGCLFQGPTSITLNWTGTMTVVSPETPSDFNTGACGTANWASGATVDVPSGEVVYVESPTGSYSCTTPSGFPYPPSGDTNTATGPSALKPSCSHGDAFVKGWLSGKLTIGAANNIYVTGNIRYRGTNTDQNIGHNVPNDSDDSPYSRDTEGSDVLGLSANNFVEILHSLKGCGSRSSRTGQCSSASNNGTPLTDIQIDAAIVASNDSFLVQDYDSGPALGVLTINGGLIQAFRGPVATSSGGDTVASGYAKDYNYDPRLLALSPPHLADLASSAWNVAAFGEGSPH
jgi:Tfp pilus assembly protein PilX